MKLKKILSLVVTLALVFSMVTISNVQAAEDEFAILKALGINADFSDDTTPITRIQLAEIALALSGDLANADGDPIYPDVPVKHKYFPIVNTVTNEGLMSALADGSFGPEVNASGMDMGRVLLAELGYSAFGKQANWTDAQYNSKVQQLNLMRGVNASDGLTAREAGKMIVNMITTKVMEISTITSEGISFKESNLTYIENRYGYVLRTGEMQASGRASKTGTAPVNVNQAVIDGVIYRTNGQSYADYVGYFVKYILTSPYEDGQLIHAEKYFTSAELVIKAEDIVDYVDYKLSYMDENGSLEVVNFSSAARIVINGQNAAGYDARWFRPDHGSITFVDTDANEIYDVVKIETKVYFKVGGASSYSISDQWTHEVIETKDHNSVYVYNDGVGAELMSFETGAYAEVAPGAVDYVPVAGNEMMKPDYANSDIISINLIPTTTVTGKVTGKKTNAIMVDDVFYEVNPFFADLVDSNIAKTVPVGAQADFVINEKGQIIDIINIVSDYVSVSDSLTYGYMLSMNGINVISKGAYIKIVDFYNLEELILKTSDDCKINGKEFDYNKVSAVDPTTTSASIYWPNGEFKDQIIKYSLNKDGEINNLYLAKNFRDQYLMTGYISYSDTIKNPDYDPNFIGYDTNNFTIDLAGNDLLGAPPTIQVLYSLTKERSVQLKIPPKPSELDKWSVYANVDPSDITIINTFHTESNIEDNALEVYDSDEKYTPAIVVRREAGGSGLGIGDGEFSDQTRSIIVTSVEDVWDDVNGEVKRQIVGCKATPQGVKTVTLLPNSKNLMTTIAYEDIKDGANRSVESWNDIVPGDIIRVRLDAAGEVGGFGIIVDAEDYENLSDPNFYYGRLAKKANYNYTRYEIGYVTTVWGEVEGGIMNLNGPEGKVDGYFRIGQPRPKAGGNQTVGAAMVWDVSARKGTMASCADMRVGDIAIVHQGGGYCLELLIIRP